LKTLHLTNAWAETSGGIATFYKALMAGANRRNRAIRLVVPAAEDRVEQVGECGKIYHIRAPKAPFNSAYRTIYPSQYLVVGSRLQSILASERPDLIEICDKYTFNYLGALIRMRLVPALDYRPVVVGFSQERMDDNVRAYLGSAPFARIFCSIYMKWLYFPFFDHHIANSEYTAAELRSVADGHLVPRGTWIRPMGVDLEHLSPLRRKPELRRRLLQNFGSGEDGILLLYAGRLVPEKNLRLLFDVLARLARDTEREYRLLVVGDGIERDAWERKCQQETPGSAFFFGHIGDRNVLADLYANADVFVHPNPREPFGIAPLEAMASGLPLVAPNDGGVTTYANNENAWTVDASVEAFVAAIREASGPTLVAQKRERAIQTAQRYQWDRVADSFLELYDELYRQGSPNNTAQTPVFYSTQAKGLEAALTRGVANLAADTFRFWSKRAARKNLPLEGKIPRENARPEEPSGRDAAAGDPPTCASATV